MRGKWEGKGERKREVGVKRVRGKRVKRVRGKRVLGMLKVMWRG